MQLIRKVNKGFWFLLCVTDIYSQYDWVIPLKDKKNITITNAFQKIKYGLIKIVNYNRSVKSWLEKNDTEM